MTETDLLNLLDELLALPAETEWVEFKEAKRNYDFNKLGKYVSALSLVELEQIRGQILPDWSAGICAGAGVSMGEPSNLPADVSRHRSEVDLMPMVWELR